MWLMMLVASVVRTWITAGVIFIISTVARLAQPDDTQTYGVSSCMHVHDKGK